MGDESYAISPARRVPSLPVSKPLDPHHNAKPVQIVSMATERHRRNSGRGGAQRRRDDKRRRMAPLQKRLRVKPRWGRGLARLPPENIDAADRAGPSAWIEEVGSDDVEGAAVAAGEDGFEEWDEDELLGQGGREGGGEEASTVGEAEMEDELERSGDKIPDAGEELATATQGASTGVKSCEIPPARRVPPVVESYPRGHGGCG
ncbi:hypothetical protein B0H17DRAFT_1134244 [Mycena rosella]|uniref:Uncharacterized protein n=1 Tax=Mycena rosella TaxID=1033263 RepID=A0AAD7DJ17_MYCRO|nr:hypothetical protein B0H17DRAFT_1134244 [Mycena rosella]